MRIARNGRAQREAVRGVVADLVQLRNMLDVDDEVGGLSAGAQLHQQVRAAGQ